MHCEIPRHIELHGMTPCADFSFRNMYIAFHLIP
jgi:hypothetical protein